MSRAVFPRQQCNRGRSYFGGAELEDVGNDFVMTGNAASKRGVFHREQMAEARSLVRDRFAMDKHNELQYLNGGIMGAIPKPQPQGSFNRPLNLNGSTTYARSSAVIGAGGTFMTQPGQQYGKELLRRRAKQLDELEAMASGVPLVPKTAEELRMSVEEEKELTAEKKGKLNLKLAIANVVDAINAGVADIGKTKELSGIFSTLRGKLGKEQDSETLQQLKNELQNANQFIRDDVANTRIQSQQDQQQVNIKMSVSVALSRVIALIDCLITSINLQPRERELYVDGCAKKISSSMKLTPEFIAREFPSVARESGEPGESRMVAGVDNDGDAEQAGVEARAEAQRFTYRPRGTKIYRYAGRTTRGGKLVLDTFDRQTAISLAQRLTAGELTEEQAKEGIKERMSSSVQREQEENPIRRDAEELEEELDEGGEGAVLRVGEEEGKEEEEDDVAAATGIEGEGKYQGSGRTYFSDEIGKVGGRRRAAAFEPIEAQLQSLDLQQKRELAKSLNSNIDNLPTALVRATGAGMCGAGDMNERLQRIMRKVLLKDAPQEANYADDEEDGQAFEAEEDDYEYDEFY